MAERLRDTASEKRGPIWQRPPGSQNRYKGYASYFLHARLICDRSLLFIVLPVDATGQFSSAAGVARFRMSSARPRNSFSRRVATGGRRRLASTISELPNPTIFRRLGCAYGRAKNDRDRARSEPVDRLTSCSAPPGRRARRTKLSSAPVSPVTGHGTGRPSAHSTSRNNAVSPLRARLITPKHVISPLSTCKFKTLKRSTVLSRPLITKEGRALTLEKSDKCRLGAPLHFFRGKRIWQTMNGRPGWKCIA